MKKRGTGTWGFFLMHVWVAGEQVPEVPVESPLNFSTSQLDDVCSVCACKFRNIRDMLHGFEVHFLHAEKNRC